MAFCDQCGLEIKATAKFCGRCGAEVLPDPQAAPPSRLLARATDAQPSPADRATTPAASISSGAAPQPKPLPTPSTPTEANPGLDRLAARVAGAPEIRNTGSPGKTAEPPLSGLDLLAARVAGTPEARTRANASGFSIPASSGGTTGVPLKWLYLAGVVLISIGIRTAFFVTRLTTNLLTGQTSTSYPDMGVGIILVVIGAALVAGTWLAAGGRRPR